MSSEEVRYLRDKIQALTVAGDALATAVAGALGADNDLLCIWDEAKRHGEVPRRGGDRG